MIGLQCGTGSLLSGENGGSLWQDELDTLKGKVEPNRGGEKKKERKKRRRRREGGCINWRGGAPGGEGWQNNIHTRALRPSRSPLSPISSGRLFVGCLGGVLVPTPLPMDAQKKQIFVFALRAWGAIQALFTRAGRCPLTYHLVLAFLSLSQGDLHQQGSFCPASFTHTPTAYFSHCVWVYGYCMEGVLWDMLLQAWKQRRKPYHLSPRK